MAPVRRSIIAPPGPYIPCNDIVRKSIGSFRLHPTTRVSPHPAHPRHLNLGSPNHVPSPVRSMTTRTRGTLAPSLPSTTSIIEPLVVGCNSSYLHPLRCYWAPLAS